MKEKLMYFLAFALGGPQDLFARGIAKMLYRFQTNVFDLREGQDCEK
jgi:hypothetical protein